MRGGSGGDWRRFEDGDSVGDPVEFLVDRRLKMGEPAQQLAFQHEFDFVTGIGYPTLDIVKSAITSSPRVHQLKQQRSVFTNFRANLA